MNDVALREALAELGRTLARRGLDYHLVVIGGSALVLSQGLRRATQDVDVVAAGAGTPPKVIREIPPDLEEAARDVADALDLGSDWLNAGAVAVVENLLPTGFAARMQTESFGEALLVSTLARLDLLRLKFAAAIDEGSGSVHVTDLIDVGITRQEIDEVYDWFRGRSVHDRSAESRDVLDALRRSVRT